VCINYSRSRWTTYLHIATEDGRVMNNRGRESTDYQRYSIQEFSKAARPGIASADSRRIPLARLSFEERGETLSSS